MSIVRVFACRNCGQALLADRVGVTTAECHDIVTELFLDGFVKKVVGGYALVVPG